MSTETIKSKAYRILVGNGLWDRISFWSKAADTEAADGKNLETKVGAVDGITSDVTSTSTNYAASIKTVHDLNANLTANSNPFKFGYEDGKYGYYLPDGEGGADTLHPFNSKIYFDETIMLNWETIGTSSTSCNGTWNQQAGQYTGSSTQSLTFDIPEDTLFLRISSTVTNYQSDTGTEASFTDPTEPLGIISKQKNGSHDMSVEYIGALPNNQIHITFTVSVWSSAPRNPSGQITIEIMRNLGS